MVETMKLYNTFAKKIKDMSEHLKQILEYATSQGYRSNVVKPLMGILSFSVIITIGGAYLNCNIVIYFGIGLTMFLVAAFLFAYFFCLFKDPNLLRSERYNLEKTAIEKATIKGDSNLSGYIKAPNTEYLIVDGSNNTCDRKEELE